MQWGNLKNGNCPGCNSKLRTAGSIHGRGLLKCDECEFICKEQRAKQILYDLEMTAEQKALDKQADDFLKKHKCYIPKY